MSDRELFTPSRVRRLTGATRCQLRYWNTIGLVPVEHRTHGGHARYDHDQVLDILISRRLIDAGVSLRRQRALDLLPVVRGIVEWREAAAMA